MPDIENNMDDLFRRAAEAYPLKTSNDEWDDIAPLINNSIVVDTDSNKRKSIKKYSALLLSLILFLLITGVVSKYNPNKKITVLAGQSQRKMLDKEIADNNKIQEAGGMTNKRIADKKRVLIYTEDAVKQNDFGTKNSTTLYEKRKFRYKIYSEVSDEKESKKMQSTGEPVINEKIVQKEIGNEKFLIKKHHFSEYLSTRVVSHQSILPIQLPGKKEGVSTEEKPLLNNKGKVKKHPGIYMGFMFGPSFNQIKAQGLKKPGYDIGIIAGYQISKSLSVETGLMYDRKNYFSSGEYFDMSKVSASMPADMKLLSLEGSCAIFEIPVKIKYNLRSKGNTNFYSTAGISTYIITNEYNKYRAVTNGTEQNITGTYNNTSRYLAAALDLSLGYQSKIGSLGSIRIEPYVQIPLQGIGVGSLPVMTAGLHIGFTRLIH